MHEKWAVKEEAAMRELLECFPEVHQLRLKDPYAGMFSFFCQCLQSGPSRLEDLGFYDDAGHPVILGRHVACHQRAGYVFHADKTRVKYEEYPHETQGWMSSIFAFCRLVCKSLAPIASLT